MQTIQMEKDLDKIIKEGFLDKESRHLKAWRRRWFVLTPNALYSFKQRKEYLAPTQILSLRDITALKPVQEKEFSFTINTQQISFLLGATSNVQKEQWIGQINKAMTKLSSKEAAQ